jgi:hypothetical protein
MLVHPENHTIISGNSWATLGGNGFLLPGFWTQNLGSSRTNMGYLLAWNKQT